MSDEHHDHIDQTQFAWTGSQSEARQAFAEFSASADADMPDRFDILYGSHTGVVRSLTRRLAEADEKIRRLETTEEVRCATVPKKPRVVIAD